ncbi:hypothetical protein ACUN0C_00440 [Faunimonas sp. B44]|uniref:hypothetical protein n=1 Tax=Faunimonas sp. B44 TaxID=3461493 RepID=UPI004043BEDF
MAENSFAGMLAATACIALLLFVFIVPRGDEPGPEVRVATWPWENAQTIAAAPEVGRP